MSGVTGAIQRIEDWFHKIRVNQGSFEFRHVLGEYVDEESIKQGFPSNKKATSESGKIAIDGGRIRNIAGRVYSSRVLVIQDSTEIDELEKINRCQETYSELKRCLTSAGQELEFPPIYECLPPEITRQNDCALRWLLYLHYATKPDRNIWDLISSQAIVAKALGQELPSGESNLWNEIPSVIGPFSFDLLGQNSYSIIEDIATSSILAIRLMHYGKLPDSKSADNKTEADYGLPESVKQEAEKIAKQQAEAARRSRLTDASDGVRLYTPEVSGPVFCEEITKRILAFGQVLKDDGWYRHLSDIQAPWTQQHQIDAFREAIEILQTAISGDGSTVLARLKNIYETDHIEDASLRTAKRDYRQWVFDSLRREILFKLTEKEYFPSKDQAAHPLDDQKAEASHLNSDDGPDREPNQDYTIGQLIRDLSEYRTLIERADSFFQKQAGQPALKDSLAAHYIIQGNVIRSDASKVWNRIPADVIDLIRPLCEADGEFDVKTLKILRANICIYFGESESFVDSMNPSEFRRLSVERSSKRREMVEPLLETLLGAHENLQSVSERVMNPPSLIMPPGINVGQSQLDTSSDEENRSIKLGERYEKAFQSYQFAESNLGKCTDRDAYDWLTENGPSAYELPGFDTWKRYVREGRKHYNASKNTPLAGRTGRSIVGPEG